MDSAFCSSVLTKKNFVSVLGCLATCNSIKYCVIAWALEHTGKESLVFQLGLDAM